MAPRHVPKVSIGKYGTASHCGINGNEFADRTANKALDESLVFEVIANKTSLPDWINKAKSKLRKDVQSWYEKTSESKGKVTFELFPNFPLKQWYHHSPLNTTIIKKVNRILSNHGYTNKFLYMIKKVQSNNCDVCCTTEAINHILFSCLKYKNDRYF